MSTPKRYTVTAALPYANGPLHIGHLAGAYIAADVYVRHLRLQGKDVIFVCGTDEHGAAITIKAKKENTTPQAIVDQYHSVIRDSFEKFGITFDIYHRTSEKIHYDTSQDFFRVLNEKDAFEIIESEQYFDEEAKQFLADRYIMGTCPKCANENAYGDQCEKCGSSLNPTDLIHPKSTLTHSTPILKNTKHWFLKLDTQQEEIKNWLDKTGGENNWKAHVLGQCRSWLNDGLKPRAMTRDLDWGIPVPPEMEGSAGKVLYVWLDAPIGYISATKQLFLEKANQQINFSYTHRTFENAQIEDWKKYWQDEETQLIHFIGKDNIVFHCITFPAILKAHENYILPSNVPANEFMNLEGDKISTSRNWAVWLHEYLEEFPGKEDELRYCLIANMPENKDAEFTWQDFQNRVNNELAANLGNFVNRVAVLTHKFYKGEIPNVDTATYSVVFDEINELKQKLHTAIGNFKFKEALQCAMQISSVGNKFLGDNEPWKLIKTNEEHAKVIMRVSIDICAILTEVIAPLLPFTSAKLKHQFNDFTEKINPAQILFEKITDEQVAYQIEKLNKTKVTKQENNLEMMPSKAEITYDDFSKLDIRTGIILEAEKVPKADKLLKLLVDVGFEKRTIVSGIAEHFAPEEIIGREVSVLINLAPRKLRGIESNGMILMAEDGNGKLYFVNASHVAAGNSIK